LEIKKKKRGFLVLVLVLGGRERERERERRESLGSWSSGHTVSWLLLRFGFHVGGVAGEKCTISISFPSYYSLLVLLYLLLLLLLLFNLI